MLGCNLQQHNHDQVLGSGYKLRRLVRAGVFHILSSAKTRFLNFSTVDTLSGPDNSLLLGAVLCIVGCLTVSLDSTH